MNMNDDKYKHRQIDLYMPPDEVRDLAKRGIPQKALHEALGYALAYTAVGDYDSALPKMNLPQRQILVLHTPWIIRGAIRRKATGGGSGTNTLITHQRRGVDATRTHCLSCGFFLPSFFKVGSGRVGAL